MTWSYSVGLMAGALPTQESPISNSAAESKVGPSMERPS
jgi:hypothetical protein